MAEKLAPKGLEFLSVFGPYLEKYALILNESATNRLLKMYTFKWIPFYQIEKISHRMIRGDPCQMNFRNTVTRVTVEIDKNGARIRVPRIEKPLATSFSEKNKINSTGPVFRTIAL
jgi:hypothetical protein